MFDKQYVIAYHAHKSLFVQLHRLYKNNKYLMQVMQEENINKDLINAILSLKEEVHQLRLEFTPALRHTETMQKQRLSEDQIRSSIRKVRSKVNG